LLHPPQVLSVPHTGIVPTHADASATVHCTQVRDSTMHTPVGAVHSALDAQPVGNWIRQSASSGFAVQNFGLSSLPRIRSQPTNPATSAKIDAQQRASHGFPTSFMIASNRFLRVDRVENLGRDQGPK
jgi:hypothetical protein